MMKKILSIVLFFGVLAVTVQAQNKVDEQGRKQGPWKKTYPNSVAVRYEGQFKDDKPVGKFRYYDLDNMLATEITHRGDGTSYCVNYYRGGKKKSSEGKYIGQKKDSTWAFYTGSGQLLSKEYYENDVKNGPSEIYFDNGDPAIIQAYVNDVLEGEIREYYENGKLRRECAAVDGKIHGLVQTYHPNGVKQSEGDFKKGEKEGEWQFFDEEGKLEYTTLFKNNKIDTTIIQQGEFIKYFEPGKLKSVYNYKDGKKHGEFTEWHNSGVWVEEKVTDKMTQNTDDKRFLKGHHIKRKGQYFQGVLNGKIEYFDANGNPTKTETYNMGNLVD